MKSLKAIIVFSLSCLSFVGCKKSEGGSVAGGNQITGYSLSVIKLGAGGGQVLSTPSGIDCGSDCGENFVIGTTVTLTAYSANNLTSFNGWGGGCSGLADCVFVVTSSKTINATFKPYINNPSVIGWDSSYLVNRQFSYEPDMRLDSETYTRDIVNVSSDTVRNVKITLRYSSGAGGTGTVYGTSSQQFASILPGETKTFSVYTNLNPNPSSWYYTRTVEAWAPDWGVSAVASKGFPNKLLTEEAKTPFAGAEGMKSITIRVQE
jgi:hypothetical protein